MEYTAVTAYNKTSGAFTCTKAGGGSAILSAQQLPDNLLSDAYNLLYPDMETEISQLPDPSVPSSEIAQKYNIILYLQERMGGTPPTPPVPPPPIGRPITPPVTNTEIATNAITNDKIKNGEIGPEKLNFTPSGVTRPLTPPLTSAEIGNAQVKTINVNDGAITSSKLGAQSVTSSKLAPNVPATFLADYSISAKKGNMAGLAITSDFSLTQIEQGRLISTWGAGIHIRVPDSGTFAFGTIWWIANPDPVNNVEIDEPDGSPIRTLLSGHFLIIMAAQGLAAPKLMFLGA